MRQYIILPNSYFGLRLIMEQLHKVCKKLRFDCMSLARNCSVFEHFPQSFPQFPTLIFEVLLFYRQHNSVELSFLPV